MTNDEIISRLVWLEAKLTIVTAMVHCVLPATVPQSRHLALAQFAAWCDVMKRELNATDESAVDVTAHLELLTVYRNGLEKAFDKIAEFEAGG